MIVRIIKKVYMYRQYNIKLLYLHLHLNHNSFGYPFIISFNLSKYLYAYFWLYIHIYIIVGMWSVAFSRDGRFLATGSLDETVNLIQLDYIFWIGFWNIFD
jgi:hypothetical protein